MKTEIAIDGLQKKKLFVATPMYGGQCHGMFASSTADLAAICAKHNIENKFYQLFNESLITRARNYCVDEFLRSGCTHLIFIDSDIGFDAKDVLRLMALQNEESDYDIIAGPYPKKDICWEKIKMAVNQGVADDDPNVLEQFVGDYVFNPVAGQKDISFNEPVEVGEAGAGFMMIRRETFKKYDKVYPECKYRPDHCRTAHFDGSREIMAYFNCVIDPKSKRYLSEDYMFCYNVRKAGMKVWLCPWMELKHCGSYIFGGSLRALEQIGAVPTADMNQLKKKSK